MIKKIEKFKTFDTPPHLPGFVLVSVMVLSDMWRC